jgi:Tol biopolymer transport system component
MSRGSFDQRFWWIAAGLAALLGLIIALGSLAGLKPPRLKPADGKIGSPGPLTLVFPDSMQPDSVEARLSLDPPVAGRFSWRGQDGQPDRVVSFWPEQHLPSGQRYAVRLAAGARSQAGLALRQEHTWQVVIRAAEVLYLSPAGAPELWRAAPGGAAPLRLTDTGGQVFDYSVSPDGQRVVYSAGNEQRGVDLWVVGRDGEAPELVLPCQSDWCVNPAYAPDGLSLAYSRRRAGAVQGEGPGVPRIWLVDLSTGTTEQLSADPDMGGYEPAWSPDGRRLAFFDGLAGGIRVMEMASKTSFLLPSQMGLTGEWSPDGRSLVFTDVRSTEAGPAVEIYVADLETQRARRVLEDDPGPLDYSNPVWTVDGSQVVAALRPMTGGPTKQLWLLWLDPARAPAGQARQPITEDPLFTHAGYRWDPAGENLVYQRLDIGSSSQKPQIVVWNRAGRESLVLAEDAFQPRWIP